MTDHRWKSAPSPATRAASVWVIVVAAGSGSRFGGPKLSSLVGGWTVLDRSLAAACVHADGIVVVTAPATIFDVGSFGGPVVRTSGGATRSASVRAGLACVPAEVGIVVVHDAARPLAEPPLFKAVIEAVRAGADAATTAIPVVDTVKRVRGTDVVETLDRSTLVAVQTPQAFRASALRDAHAGGADATDDAGLIEQSGGRVVVVDGDVRNRKLTTVDDLELLNRFVADRVVADRVDS